jgi:hypothetical protein
MSEFESNAKKQVPLRLSAALYNELAAWAADEFRSVNGQIEYLLTEAIKLKRRSHADNRKPDEDLPRREEGR